MIEIAGGILLAVLALAQLPWIIFAVLGAWRGSSSNGRGDSRRMTVPAIRNASRSFMPQRDVGSAVPPGCMLPPMACSNARSRGGA